ncbi:RagB/SusD family nutrient uptake outer membrane protein, partial [Pararcticibacter amylolyticus]
TLGPVLFISLMAGLSSCQNLDEYNPSGATAENVWTTPEGFITNINGAYSEQRNWYGKEDGIFMAESGTDLWFNKDKSTYAQQLTQYSGLTASTGNPNRAAWISVWKAINICNAGINRIGQAGFTSVDERNRREGELRFLRGFYYWHIVETWGGVMLRTEETKEPLLTATRSSVSDFYDLIISDFEFAAQYLPVQSFWGNEYSRASKKSALGFLSRALLSRAYYAKQSGNTSEANTYFTRARDVAKDVIARKSELGTDLWSSYDQLWNPSNNKNNKEALYIVSNSTNPLLNIDQNGNRVFMTFQNNYTNKLALTQSIAYGNPSASRLMPTLTLLDYFDEATDARYNASFQEVWIANKVYTWTSADVTLYQKDASLVGKQINIGDTALVITKKVVANKSTRPYVILDRNDVYGTDSKIKTGRDFVSFRKFMDPNITAPNSQAGFNDIMVMRLAEMYIIAAEAEYGLGNLNEAAGFINVLRTRAALPGQQAAMQISAADLTNNSNFILEERAREFAGEYQRWFDLKRVLKGQGGQEFVQFINSRNPDITQVQPHHVLRPIRQEELNSLLNRDEFGQNPGY